MATSSTGAFVGAGVYLGRKFKHLVALTCKLHMQRYTPSDVHIILFNVDKNILKQNFNIMCSVTMHEFPWTQPENEKLQSLTNQNREWNDITNEIIFRQYIYYHYCSFFVNLLLAALLHHDGRRCNSE